MSLFGLLDIGKSALLASQTALSVTSHNIANVNTPGFSRQEVILNIANPVTVRGGLMGMGVMVSGIKRNYDNFIQGQLLLQQQNHGRTSAQSQVLSQVEQIFNEVKDLGLQASLQDFFNAWNDVASNPEEYAPRTILLKKADALALSAQQMERGILETLKHTNENISDITERINSISSEIARLNDCIVQTEAGGSAEKAIDLRDQRDNLLNELSNLVEFSSYEDEKGSVTVMVGMRNLVNGKTTNKLSTTVSIDGNLDLQLDGIDITSRINKGQIGGLIASREDAESSLTGVRKLVAAITNEVNILHKQGFGLDGTTNLPFFNELSVYDQNLTDSAASMTSKTIIDPSALTYDEYEIRFIDDAGTLKYNIYNTNDNSLITPAPITYSSGNNIDFEGLRVVISDGVTGPQDGDKFFISPIRDAISNMDVAITDTDQIAAAATTAGVPGDNSNALALTNLAQSQLTELGGTFESYYRGLVSEIGTISRAASDSLKFDDNLLYEIENRRESISGVSLDEEAANLIKFQRSFEAGARMIKVTDELLQTILNL